MYSTFAQSLGNVSVSRKLAAGFGLVLLLTFAIAATGWRSIDSVVEHGNTLADISAVLSSAQDLRIARQDLERLRDPAAAQLLQKAIDRIRGQVDTLLLHIVETDDRDQLEDQRQALADYQQALTALIQVEQARQGARDVLGESADKAAELIEHVQRQLLQDGNLDHYQAIVQAATLLQHARFQVRGYTYSGRADFQQTALGAIDQAVTVLEALPQRIPARYAARLEEATVAMGAYRDAIDRVGQAQEAAQQALRRMAAQDQRLAASTRQVTESQTEVRDAGVARAKALLGMAAGLALLLGTIAAFLITRQIIVPLRATLRIAERVASGDLSHDEPVRRRDELGQLQGSMQRMTLSLRELIGNLSDGVTQIASAAEQLSAVTAQTSAGVGQQRDETDQVATAMNQMAATVQEVARNAELASEAAVSADHQAREGDRVVGEAIEQIERLAREVGHSGEAMSQLRQESDKIGSVLDVIKAVAQQTNLLELNAAIEAARAGEAGRGFAVVADEVRSLAQRTQQSTEEIEELIAGLQSGTQRAASAMDSSRALTGSSVELTRRAGASLETIARTVSSIQSMNQQIATAAEQQSAVAEEINRSVISVRDISDQTSSASAQTANASVELARLGTHLRDRVAHFRL